MNDIIIRMAEESDIPAIAGIYAPYVSETTISFEHEPPSVEEMTRRWREFSATYPYLVAERDGLILGYAYAHRFAAREAWRFTVESSIYLDREHLGEGLGKLLYTRLLELLEKQGVHTVIGTVCVPNPPSEGLHRSMGFELMGIMDEGGWKKGAWRDLAYYKKHLGGHTDRANNEELINIHDIL